jgi:ATP-dependent DNA helicase RecG
MLALSQIKGVGPQMLLKLHQNDLTTARRLVLRAPIRYAVFHIDDPMRLTFDTTCTLEGELCEDAKVSYLHRNLDKLSVKIRFADRETTLVLFNRAFLRTAFRKGVRIVATGRLTERPNVFTASDACLRTSFQEGIRPVYGLKDISDKVFLKLVKEALKLEVPEETLPLALIETTGILPMRDYLSILHEPANETAIELALRRTKYEELLRFGFDVVLRKRAWETLIRERAKIPMEPVRSFIASLPFELTEEQKHAVNEIYRDLQSKRPMNRLLQGDVGSGKTIVALIAGFGVLTAGEQVAFMAPTEVLAKQHHRLFSALLSPFGFSTHYLSGSVRGEARDQVLEALKQGPSLVVGTHALFQESVAFSRLGLIVIDEQHRFGVAQRQELRSKAASPDRLYLSATPIPRTLAIALFADMDVSTIKTLPQGRKPVVTQASTFEAVPAIVASLKTRLREGRQAYVIVPTIGLSKTSEWAGVLETARWLETEWSKDKVAFLHGKMPSEEKTAVLERFAKGQIDILVSTTVIEVGVDVPNASVMIVLHADRFGLSQLHQIRGRIGRGGFAGECYLVSDTLYTEPDRFRILIESRDGFAIAEEDLRLRGPGDFLGTDQSGLPPFRTANFVTDRDLLASAFDDAKRILDAADPQARRYVESRKNTADDVDSVNP